MDPSDGGWCRLYWVPVTGPKLRCDRCHLYWVSVTGPKLWCDRCHLYWVPVTGPKLWCDRKSSGTFRHDRSKYLLLCLRLRLEPVSRRLRRKPGVPGGPGGRGGPWPRRLRSSVRLSQTVCSYRRGSSDSCPFTEGRGFVRTPELRRSARGWVNVRPVSHCGPVEGRRLEYGSHRCRRRTKTLRATQYTPPTPPPALPFRPRRMWGPLETFKNF